MLVPPNAAPSPAGQRHPPGLHPIRLVGSGRSCDERWALGHGAGSFLQGADRADQGLPGHAVPAPPCPPRLCQARKVEGELDVKLAAYSKLCSQFEYGYTRGESGLAADQVRRRLGADGRGPATAAARAAWHGSGALAARDRTGIRAGRCAVVTFMLLLPLGPLPTHSCCKASPRRLSGSWPSCPTPTRRCGGAWGAPRTRGHTPWPATGTFCTTTCRHGAPAAG